MNFAHHFELSSLEQPLHRIPPVFFDPVYWIFHKRTVAGAGTIEICCLIG